jgi:hypothetical protein
MADEIKGQINPSKPFEMPKGAVTHMAQTQMRRAMTLEFMYEGRLYRGAAYEITPPSLDQKGESQE